MGRRKFFEVWGQGPADRQPILLARVVGLGLAELVAFHLREYYQKVTVK